MPSLIYLIVYVFSIQENPRATFSRKSVLAQLGTYSKVKLTYFFSNGPLFLPQTTLTGTFTFYLAYLLIWLFHQIAGYLRAGTLLICLCITVFQHRSHTWYGIIFRWINTKVQRDILLNGNLQDIDFLCSHLVILLNFYWRAEKNRMHS